MTMTPKKRIIRTLILCLIGLAIGGAVAFFQMSMDNARIIKVGESKDAAAIPMAGVQIGGPFSLTDHTGKDVTEADYNNQFKIIYFGFTYCPAICPTELQKMASVYDAMTVKEQDRIQQLFITVDPERDSVEVMREYVDLFHPELTGLRGTALQTKDIMRRYRIFASKVQNEEMSDYTIDHSTFLYLMSPDNQLLSIYRMKDEADFIVQDIRKFLSKS